MINTDLEKRFEELVLKVKDYYPSADFGKLKKAFEFAKLAHADEKRLSGLPFVGHPLETAVILTDWKMDKDTIVAALLHDTIDHGAATKDDILTNFGDEVCQLVEGVTNVSQVRLKGSTDKVFVENLRKMFLAIAKDLRIVFLRLAERIDNLKTLEYLPIDNQQSYAKEGLEIYAPLAERLGMWKVKTQIDDLSFKYAYPNEYQKVTVQSLSFFKNAENRIFRMKKKILSELNQQGVKAKVYGRKKGLYSLFNKLERPEVKWDFEKVQDIVALRILTDSIKDCYIALSSVYKYYKPVPHIPIADYISAPKPNGYQSIHIKVYGDESFITEVQIRTNEMHEQAEKGVAAHWAYSDAKSHGVSEEVRDKKGVFVDPGKLSWVKQLAEWQKEISDSDEFLKAVKFDALSRRIFVFTPNGDVYDLPENSTPIDFAFAVHTKLAEYLKGAKVNDKIVPLDYKLSSGQVVEILKHKEKIKPNRDWLDFAVTTMARREIKKSLRK